MNELPTVGVEEEFILVDPQTGEPVPHNAAVAAEAKRRGITLQLELSGCQVVTTSSVATNSTELGHELIRLRAIAAAAAEAAGVQLLALGLPPVTAQQFPVSDTERYRRIGASARDDRPRAGDLRVSCARAGTRPRGRHSGQQLAATLVAVAAGAIG